jgi:hypothetical protein
MAKIRIVGDSSGYVEIAAPNAAGNNTLELPSGNTRLVGSDSAGNVSISGIVTAATFSGNVNSTSGITTVTTLRATSIVGVTTAGITTAYIGAVNDGPLSGARNRIINGSMEISQRGTSSASTGYLLDRWVATNVSAQSQSSDAPTNFINSVEFTSNTTTFPYIEQRLERSNSFDLSGKTITVSFWAKSISGTSNLYVEIYRANSNDNFSALTIENNGAGVVVATSPSTSWTYYTAQLSLSSSATTGIVFRIIRNNASAASTRVTGVQLESGPVATPFERRSYGQELALCQRYYETGTIPINGLAAQYSANVYTASNPGFGCIPIPFAVTKRATPSISSSTGSSYWVVAGSFAVTAQASHTFITPGITQNTVRFVSNRVAGNSAPDAGRIYMWEENFTWTASAEL